LFYFKDNSSFYLVLLFFIGTGCLRNKELPYVPVYSLHCIRID